MEERCGTEIKGQESVITRLWQYASLWLYVSGILDDAVPATGLAGRETRVPGNSERDAQPQAIRPDVDAGCVHSQPQVWQFPHHYRSQQTDPSVSGRHNTVQSAAHVDSRLRHDARQVPDGQPDVQDWVRQLSVSSFIYSF